METQHQVDEVQTISHQHAGGEVFEANNLEVARGICPVLGKMSLEEAGLLIELETMGKEQLAEQQKAPHEKPVIEKIAKVELKAKEIDIPSKPVVEVTKNEALREAETSASQMAQPLIEDVSDRTTTIPAEPDLLAIQVQHTEAARIFSHTNELFETADTFDVVETKPLDKKDTAPRPEELHPHVTTAFVEARISNSVQQEVKEQAFLAREYIIQQSNESPLDHPLDELRIAALPAIDTEPVVTNIDLPPTDKMSVEPILSEPADIIVTANTAGLSETEIFSADELNLDNSLPETDEGFPFATRFEESVPEEQVDQEILSFTAEFIQATEEASPLIAIPELPAPIVEIENTMEQLVEVIENDEAEESGKVAAILKTIIAMPAKTESAVDNNAEVLEEKLKELFVELFEEANIQYTSDLIDSYVKLTKAHYLEELLQTIKEPEEEAQGLPDEIGTREFLQKLQHGLSAMKQAVINFYELGKSILRLYTFSIEAAVQA